MSGRVALVEREDEQRALAGAVTAAVAGAGSLVVVDGPPGIGKSALLGELAWLGEEAGMRVLVARAGEFERDFAYGVVRTLLEREVADLDPDARAAAAAGPAGDALRLLADPGGSVIGPQAALHGIYWLVANLAASRPLALVVDDAHWCDDESMLALSYVARRRDGLRLVIAVSQRPEAGGPALAELAADPSRVGLRPRPLSAGGVRACLAERLGRPVEADLAERAHVATGGNPLLVAELGRENALAGAAGVEDALAAESLGRVFRERIRRLGAETARAAGALAVLGDDADHGMLVEVTGMPEVALEVALARLRAEGILAAGLAFAHPLARSAVRRDTGAGERRQVAVAACRLLRARVTARAGDGSGGRARAGGRPGDRGAAARRRGRRAGARRAARGGGGARARAGRAAAGGRPGGGASRARHRRAPGRARLCGGPPVRRPRGGGRPARRGRGGPGARPGPRRRRTAGRGGRRARAGAARRATRLRPSRARRTREPRRRGRRGPRGPTRMASTRWRRGPARCSPRRPTPEPGRAATGRARSRSPTGPSGGRWTRTTWRPGSGRSGSWSPAATPAPWARPTSSRPQPRASRPRTRAAAHLARGEALMAAGMPRDAEADLLDAVAVAATAGLTDLEHHATTALVEVLLVRAELAAARAALEGAPERAPSEDADLLRRLARARLALAERQPSVALREALSCADQHAPAPLLGPGVLPWRGVAAQAALALGDPARAGGLAAEELALAEAWGAPGPRSRALLAVALVDGSAVALDAALAAAQAAGPLERARALLARGRR